ncbi:MAG: hypothetical protein K0R28_4999, partial [Paenibacillus sp.]|nr:hypothetical protein [Paenibacillus sp.]
MCFLAFAGEQLFADKNTNKGAG